MIKPLSIPLLAVGGDVMAMAYRQFDHWLKHEHADCDHDSLLQCAEEYYTEYSGTREGRDD